MFVTAIKARLSNELSEDAPLVGHVMSHPMVGREDGIVDFYNIFTKLNYTALSDTGTFSQYYGEFLLSCWLSLVDMVAWLLIWYTVGIAKHRIQTHATCLA